MTFTKGFIERLQAHTLKIQDEAEVVARKIKEGETKGRANHADKSNDLEQ